MAGDFKIERKASDGKMMSFKGYCICSDWEMDRHCPDGCKKRLEAEKFFKSVEDELWLKSVGCKIVNDWPFWHLGIRATVAVDLDGHVVARKIEEGWKEHPTIYRRKYRLKAKYLQENGAP